jgi:hypothetical protein
MHKFSMPEEIIARIVARVAVENAAGERYLGHVFDLTRD